MKVFILILCILCIVALVLFLKHEKKFYFDSLVMINGQVGGGKSLLSFTIAKHSIKKAHRIWWRRKYIWGKIFSIMKNEEMPYIYCNIPFYENKKKDILHPYYKPLTTEILDRSLRPNFKSIILIDESSLVANSMDYKDKELNEKLTLWLKLVRHELHGSYRNLLGSYPNVIINTQSKNDNHFAFDRCVNQVFYITKKINLPFFVLIYGRDLLLIDSVENNFNDDIKEDISTRWYLIPKSMFNKYDSYAYSFLTDDLKSANRKKRVLGKRFEIATFHKYKEIENSNENFRKEIEKNG